MVRKTGIPVAMTLTGLGSFPGDHPLLVMARPGLVERGAFGAGPALVRRVPRVQQVDGRTTVIVRRRLILPGRSGPRPELRVGLDLHRHGRVQSKRTRHRGIVLAARKADQAKQLVRRFPAVEATEMSVEGLAGIKTDLIVNATPVGMAPHLTESPWPLELAFPEDAFVYDLVYNPAETKLVQLARAAGLRATTGLGMLIEQAILAFELWTGCKVQQEVMLQAVAQSAHI